MRTKDKLIELFENNKGIYFSGEEIAERLNVSRAAVWKAVNVLRSDGYSIDAVPNKGYCLSERTDIFSVQGIQKYLKPICSGLQMEFFSTIESTNNALRERAEAGGEHGLCILANSQTAGKGRVGRKYFSPSDTGTYMSMLLRPKRYTAAEAVKITTMAAVAVCEAIEAFSKEKPGIKWVNDIYMRNRKVCGILTEASFSMETGFLDYAVLGVGINVYSPECGFPKEVKNIAGAVFDQPQNDGKNRLAAEFFNRFMEIFEQAESSDYVSKYRKRSFLIGKEVDVIFPEKTRKALVLDVDDNCHLLVRYDNGEEDELSSGEVSLDINGLCRREENTI